MKFTDCIEIVGSKPTLYEGTKQYVSTGAVEEYFINEKSIEEYSYKERPSRADLVGKSGDILFAKMAETKKTLILDKETENYLKSVLKRITTVGALSLAVIAGLPIIFGAVSNLSTNISIGGTGLLIVVGVALETYKQLDGELLTRSYMKKGRRKTKCLYYLLNSKNFLNQKDKNSSGATQKAITNAGLEKINVNIPLFFKQDQIVKQFDLLTDIIKKYQSQLKKLDSLIKSRFIEMFGDPVQNPKKWDIKKMSDYILFLTSGSRGWSEYFSNEGKLFLTIKNVKNNRINIENIQYVQAPNNKEAERTKVQENDLLISITADLGRTGVVSKEIANYGAYINQHLSLVRLNTEKVNPLFVSYYLETDGGKLQFNKKNQSAVKAGLNFEAIKSLTFMNPPLKKQNEFVSFVQQIDKSKFAVQKSLEKAETLYKSLMQEYFG